jgi:hypothetical protein
MKAAEIASNLKPLVQNQEGVASKLIRKPEDASCVKPETSEEEARTQ